MLAHVRRRCLSGTRLLSEGGALEGLCNMVVESGVARLTLNHGAKRNALGVEMVDALSEHVDALAHDSSVRILLIDSVPGTVFSSGHNLVELSTFDRAQQEDLMRTSTQTMLKLQALPMPVLCLVDGLAAAAGAQLVAHCDMAFCTARSSFSTPGVRYGFFCTTPGAALYQRSAGSNSKMLMHMLFTGDAISAADALRIGLVSHVFDDGHAMSRFAQHTVERIVSLPRDVIALGKSAFHRQSQMKTHSTAMNFATDIMIDNLQMDVTKEGLAAFAAKRPPKWD